MYYSIRSYIVNAKGGPPSGREGSERARQPRSKCCPPSGRLLLELLKGTVPYVQEVTSTMHESRSTLDHGTMDSLAEGESYDAGKFKDHSSAA